MAYSTAPPWMADALCREHPEVEFYIGQGGDPEPARAVCARCVVRDDCRAYALELGEEYGIWGGTSAIERLRLLRRRAGVMDNNPALEAITEKELLLELFREVRAIKRFLIGYFLVAPVVLFVLAIVVSAVIGALVEKTRQPVSHLAGILVPWRPPTSTRWRRRRRARIRRERSRTTSSCLRAGRSAKQPVGGVP